MQSELDQNSNLVVLDTLATINTDSGFLPLIKSIGTGPPITIHDFLARPALLYTFTGSGNIPFTEDQYLYDYLNLGPVQNKMQFFHLLRGTMQLDFILTVNPYACGQIIISRYLGTFLSTFLTNTDTTATLYTMSTQHHVILDCSTNNRAQLRIPITPPNPYIDVSLGSDPAIPMFKMATQALTPLVSTFDGTNSAFTLRVYASIVNAELTIPLAKDAAAVYTSEVNKTLGSFPLTQTITNSLKTGASKALRLGAFAMASSVIDTLGTASALIAGFARPKNISDMNYPHDETYTDSEGPIRVKGLTLDPMQEIPVISTQLGENNDNLHYSQTIMREGLVATFTWTTVTTPDTSVLYLPVAPNVSYFNTSTFIACPCPLAYYSQLFSLWRGSIKYRIVIPSNRYCRGKLRFFWNPVSLNTSSEYTNICQNAPSVILDLSTSSEVEITVPWGMAQQYLPIDLLSLASNANLIPNGYLYAMVEEQLVMPQSSMSLEILVWMSGTDNTHFFIPDVRKIQYYHRQNYVSGWNTATQLTDDLTSYTRVPTNGPGYVYDPDNIGYGIYTADLKPYENQPVSISSHTLFPEASSDMVNLLQMGESFESFRPFLKRFFPSRYIYESTATQFNAFFQPYDPIEPLFYYNGTAYQYPPYMLHPLTYIANAFYGHRGSIRYRINMVITNTSGTSAQNRINVSRCFAPTLSVTAQTASLSYPWFKSLAGGGEATYAIVNEPIYFEIPYQAVSQYQNTVPDATYATIKFGVQLEFITNNAASNPTIFELYCAAGEDYNPVLWNGIPQVTLYAIA
jgi:hypothetical protein